MEKLKKIEDMTTLRGDIGKKIREIRLEKGLSQEGFGRLIQKSKSAVSKYESGDAVPSPETVQLICDVGGIESYGSFFISTPHEHYEATQREKKQPQGNEKSLTADEYELLELVKGIEDFREKMDLREVMETFLKLPRSKQKKALGDMLAELEELEENRIS